jgi:hypothetical protein
MKDVLNANDADLSKEQIFFQRPIYTLESRLPVVMSSSMDGPLNLQTSGIVSANFDSRESYDYVQRGNNK